MCKYVHGLWPCSRGLDVAFAAAPSLREALPG